ncbi:MAG: phenylacetate--CoA ligase family protein [Burkholderiales bacterium]
MSDYFAFTDPAQLAADYPAGEAFLKRFTTISADELRALQEERFARVLALAWKTPFYRRLWGARGIEPGDIRGLADLPRLPTFDKSDIMESIAKKPPFGDFHAMDAYEPGQRPPVVFHTTSGTTGRPQVLLFGPRGREAQNRILARTYLLQGLTDDDVVHSVYGHGLINGGHYIRETFLHWTRAIFMSAGTGVETRSAAQVELMRDFGATVIVGFGDYIRYLGDAAKNAGLDIKRDFRVRMISGHLGSDREAIAAAWGGVETFDWYGVGDTGIIAGEGPDHDGLYVHEDAQWVELTELDSDTPAAPGAPGNLVVTVLMKDDIYPMIRFNTHDVTRFLPGQSSLGLRLRRISGFEGRSDNMVKLRGINIFPQAVGAILAELPAYGGDYYCRVDREANGREGMTVVCETRDASSAQATVYAELLKRRIGIEVSVEFAAPGELKTVTGIDSRQKPLRLVDTRK